MGSKFRNIVMISILAVAGIFGISSALINKQVSDNNVAEKADASTTISSDQFIMQIVDFNYASSEGYSWYQHDLKLRIRNVQISPYCIFNDVLEASEAGAFWSKMSYIEEYGGVQAIELINDSYGTYNTKEDGERPSYTFNLPWWIVGFDFQVHFNRWGQENWSSTISGVSEVKKQVRWLKDSSGWYIDGYVTYSAKYDVPAHTITFDTNGGSEIADNPYKFREWQKTSAPSNPTKFAATFSKWTLDNYSSADAFTFGEALEEDITLYAQWTYNLSSNIIMWKPANNDYIEFKSSHSWNKSGNESIDVEEISYSSISIKGDTYYYVNPTNSPSWVVFHKTGSWGIGNQTADLPIPSGGLSGQYYYDLGGTNSWQRISFTITYKDQGGEDPTAENMASLVTTHYYGSSTDLVSGTKAGYSFDGWFTNSDCEGTAITSLNGVEYVNNITLYAKWTCGEDAAMEFVNAFNDDVGAKCVNHDSNTIETYKTNWNSTHESNYNAIKGSDYITYWLDSSHGSTQANREAVALMLSRYEYILKKYGYGDSKLHDFMGKDPGTLGAIRDFSPLSLFGDSEDNLSTVIIIVASSVALLSVTALSILVIMKRKNKED